MTATRLGTQEDERPLVAHVIYRFAVGGTENGIVNLINHLPAERYRHLVVALLDVDPVFAARVRVPDVRYVALAKRPGHGFRLYPRLYRLFRQWRPAIVHTRNLGALEAMVPAWAAGVRVRIHGEHGWDMSDPGGVRRRYRVVRRAYRPFVRRYVAVSRGLVGYLRSVGVRQDRIEQIYNGVDLRRYARRGEGAAAADMPFRGQGQWIVGTVGRMHAVKDPLNLVRAFIRALAVAPHARERLRLVMIGDGPLHAQARAELAAANADALAWLPGERSDIPALLRTFDCFVLPSLAEGISNTVLEAMACGLPVVATDVGGNAELIVPGETGDLVPPVDQDALARRILALAQDPALARRYGDAGRARAEALFSLDGMVARYQRLYDSMLAAANAGAGFAQESAR